MATDRFCGACGSDLPLKSSAPDSKPSAGSTARASFDAWDGIVQRLKAATEGEYEIIAEIGRGGMAAVFLAHDIALNRKVAIKMMSPGILTSEGMVERFRNEAWTVANLSHANIVTMHAFRDVDDLHFFVMEFIDGKALDRVIASHAPLPFDIVRAVLAQVGGALAYAHRRGVIHRDVKPANILIGAEGEALVTDFGIAKVVESPSRTQTGAVHGTATYMSPEQCFASPLTAATDQYSLGVVAYEMIAGRTPFVGSVSFTLMQAHTTERPPALREFRPDCPEDLEAAVLRMLAKAPEERFGSITEALGALKAVPVFPGDPVLDRIGRMAEVGAAAPLHEIFRTPGTPVTPVRGTPPRRSTPVSPSIAVHRVEPIVIAIAPLTRSLEPGDKAALTVTRGRGKDAESLVTADRIRWTSSDPTIATVDEATGSLSALNPGTATLTAAAEGASATIEVLVAPARPARITIDAPRTMLTAGDEVLLTATVHDKHGAPLARSVRWTSSDPETAAITRDGHVTASAAGSVTVSASCDNAHGELRLSVRQPAVAGVRVQADRVSLAVGDTILARATAVDAKGAALEGRRIVWSTGDKSIAAVSAAGLVTGVAPGSVNIIALCEDVRGELPMFVALPEVALVEIAPVVGEITTGKKFRLKARALGVGGQELARPITWRSTDASIASVTSDGLVSPMAPGRVAIFAESGGCEAQVDFTIAPPIEVPVAARPPRPLRWRSGVIGGVVFLGLAAAFVLRGQLGSRSGGAEPATPSKTVDTPKIQLPPPPPGIDSGKPGGSGGQGGPGGSAGPTGGTDGAGKPGGTVEPPPLGILAIVPVSGSIAQGDSTSLSLVRKGAAANLTTRDIRWSSSNPSIALVSPNGMLRGVAPGTARIVVQTPNARDSVVVTIVARRARVAAVAAMPSTLTMQPGANQPLRAVARDDAGAELADRPISFVSRNPSVAAVDASGVVTALKPGAAEIVVASEGITSVVAVTVPEPAKPPSGGGDPPPPPPGPKALTARRVYAGGNFSCAAAESGPLTCWGRGGDAARFGRSFSDVAIGGEHACGVSGGTAMCWGSNDQGQLGDGSTTAHGTPTAVAGSTRFTEITAGGAHTCALDQAGLAYCWGRNTEGQLGTGDKESKRAPTPVGDKLTFKAMAAGAKHTCAITTDNVAYCWGDGFGSAVGVGNRREFFTLPMKVDTRVRFTAIAAGDNFSCGLATSGAAYCWGENRSGQLGDGSRNERGTPNEVRGTQGLTQIAAGRYHACAIASDGTVLCWGENGQGQLGNGTQATRPSPASIDSEQRFSAISLGASHTCAVTRGGEVLCWGANARSQLGVAAEAVQKSPAQVKLP